MPPSGDRAAVRYAQAIQAVLNALNAQAERLPSS